MDRYPVCRCNLCTCGTHSCYKKDSAFPGYMETTHRSDFKGYSAPRAPLIFMHDNLMVMGDIMSGTGPTHYNQVIKCPANNLQQCKHRHYDSTKHQYFLRK